MTTSPIIARPPVVRLGRRPSDAPARDRSRARAGRGRAARASSGTPAGSCSRPTRSSTAYSCAWCCSTPNSSVRVLRSTSVEVRPSRICTVLPHLGRHILIVGDDQHGDAESLVDLAHRVEDELRVASRRARRSVRRRTAPLARWPARRRWRRAAAARPTSGRAAGRASPRCRAGRAARRPAPRGRARGVRATESDMPMFSAAVRYGRRLRAGLLPDEADGVAAVLRALAGRHREQVVAGDPGRSRRRHVEPGQDGEQRRLAGAGGADDRGQLAALHGEREALQCLHLDALGGEDPHQVGALDVGGHPSPILRVPAGAKRRPRAEATIPASDDDDDERGDGGTDPQRIDRRGRLRTAADEGPQVEDAGHDPRQDETERRADDDGRDGNRARAPRPTARAAGARDIPRMRSTPTVRLRAVAAATEPSTTVSMVSSSDTTAAISSAVSRPATVGRLARDRRAPSRCR